MKTPAECASLDEVRAEIDRIDRAIVALIGERAGYVHAAARFKASEAAVAAPERQAVDAAGPARMGRGGGSRPGRHRKAVSGPGGVLHRARDGALEDVVSRRRRPRRVAGGAWPWYHGSSKTTPEVFVARITRKELKTDKFALEVEHTVTFFEEHQKEIIRYGAIALAVIVLIIGYSMYSRRQHSKRAGSAVPGDPDPGGAGRAADARAVNRNFPTQEVKDQTALKAFTDVQSAYPGTSRRGDRHVLPRRDQGRSGQTGRSGEGLQGSGRQGR